jgi:hypothetical protein
MQTPPVQTRPVPSSALFHFALPQREYAATLAAVQYFARKLQAPSERALAESALTWLQNLNGMTLASEQEAPQEPASVKVEPVPSPPAKGLASLKGTSK